MPDLSTILTRPGYTDWVYDPQRNLVEIVTGNGMLHGWSIDSQAYTLNLQIGGTPNSVDITANGAFLVVGNRDTVATATPAYAVMTRVNLDSLAANQVQIPLPSAAHKGIAHLATSADGMVVFNRQTGQFGVNPYQQFQVDAPTPALTGVAPLVDVDNFNHILRSDDHRYLLFQDVNSGDGKLTLYDTDADRVVAVARPGGFNTGRGDVSDTARLGVTVQGNNIYVFDLTLQLVKNLSSLQINNGVIGGTFSDDGHQLFLWSAATGNFGGTPSVIVLDTQSWQQVGVLTPKANTVVNDGNTKGPTFGTMGVAGQVLVLDNGAQLELIDLATNLKLTVTGDASAQSLWGGIGQDSLSGAGGADMLSGGRGTDTLAGGADGDVFAFVAGDSAAVAGQTDVITDWSSTDALRFGGGIGSPANYAEASAATFAEALTLANQQIAGGVIDYVAVAVGADVLVFADSRGNNGGADDAVKLSGRSLADIGAENFRGAAAPAGVTLPPPPPAPVGGAVASVQGNMDAAHLSSLITSQVQEASDTFLSLSNSIGFTLNVTATGLSYLNNKLVGGNITGILFAEFTPTQTVLSLRVSGVSVAASRLEPWLAADATTEAFQTFLAGSNVIEGSDRVDLIRGFAGDDQISGRGGADTLFGGLGNDIIFVTASPATTFPSGIGPAGATYLRGEEGDDYIIGGGGFDDINGNMGNDTASGGVGEDWVVGGKDNDLLFGDAAYDLVYGNLGNDTCEGGDGNDIIRGGQDNDVVRGGAGDDYVSGDRGDDTMTGNAGADIFHSFGEAGVDRVTDFSLAEGDRVQLDPGTQYTVAQVGSDTVISMAGGGQVILVGVPMSSLAGAWILVG